MRRTKRRLFHFSKVVLWITVENNSSNWNQWILTVRPHLPQQLSLKQNSKITESVRCLHHLLHGCCCPMWSDMTLDTYLSSGKKTGRQPMWSTMYSLQTILSDNQPTSSIMVSAKSFLDKSRPLSLQPTQMGSRFIRPLCAEKLFVDRRMDMRPILLGRLFGVDLKTKS